ncbi:hypothetical protein MAXJ12_23892 [Mesorhizobium alhagi CCNWXJ12-2]|uniref:Uncharacterized protein n=1 Tax=Mesorhizobium alhagi CCNWXJ12-2 TaxID=1107882 RepID=H0HX59_9HYPH|nr:hypothetical protein MAXJ12_23892 [Mesorhizobium alhagi CCNWXJ12-2]
MDPNRFNPFSPDWQQYYAALTQQRAGQAQQAGEAGREDFQQHLSDAATAGPSSRQRYFAAPGDERLIQQAADYEMGRGITSESLVTRRTGLRKLSQKLQEIRGVGIAGLSDDSLRDFAREYFPGNRGITKGLSMLKRYRQTQGEGSSRAAEGYSGQPVHQPAPSPVSSFDQDEIWRLHDAAEQPAPSPHSVNSTEFWAGVDQRGQLPTDSWNTTNFWRGLDSPAHSPAPSVNQPSPPSMEQSAWASFFGPTYVPYAPPPAPDLAVYVPDWQHGDQRASVDLMRGMHWQNVLPSASQPQTNFTVNGVPYTAALGRSGRQDDIQVYRA